MQTRARVLVEIMKGPTSRVKLKERMIDLSTKDVDYHILRAENSLLKLKVIREINNRMTYIVHSLETLVNTAEILTTHKEKRAAVRDSIDSAYAKCSRAHLEVVWLCFQVVLCLNFKKLVMQ